MHCMWIRNQLLHINLLLLYVIIVYTQGQELERPTTNAGGKSGSVLCSVYINYMCAVYIHISQSHSTFHSSFIPLFKL